MDKRKEQPIVPMPIKATPYQHQVRGFNACMVNEGYGLLYDVGLGKSLTSVAVIGARHLKDGVCRVLVICPLAVVPVWVRECTSLNIEYHCTALEGTSLKRRDCLRHIPKTGLQIVIVNYEGSRILVDDLIKWAPEILIVDESQKIKNPQSQQSKSIHKLARVAKYKIILTATPIGNSIADVYSQWRVIDEKLFGASFYAFRAKYLIMGGFQNHQIIGTKNMAELLEKMHSKAMRVSKEDALDLPAQIFETRYCELEPSAKRIYKALQSECVSELQDGEITARNVLTKMLRLQQCVDGFLRADGSEYSQIVSTAKLDLLEDTIEEIGRGEKIVIFARFTAELREIEKRLRKKGIQHLTLDGSTKDKGMVVSAFQDDEEYRVLLCQTQVGGVGITLTKASCMIFYSLTFSLIDYLQAVGRIHRIGQKSRCLYINLVAKNTIDEHIQKAIESKENFADIVVDKWQEILNKK